MIGKTLLATMCTWAVSALLLEEYEVRNDSAVAGHFTIFAESGAALLTCDLDPGERCIVARLHLPATDGRTLRADGGGVARIGRSCGYFIEPGGHLSQWTMTISGGEWVCVERWALAIPLSFVTLPGP
jgi:hypothetical protein